MKIQKNKNIKHKIANNLDGLNIMNNLIYLQWYNFETYYFLMF